MIKKVKKRDGGLEKYNINKIKKVVIAAGLPLGKTKKLLKAVDSWAKKYPEDLVTSRQIRERILIEIQKLDDYAAKQYDWYEKYRDRTFNKKK